MDTQTKPEVKRPTLKRNDAVVLDVHLMEKYQKMVNFLKNEMETMSVHLKRMQLTLSQLEHFNPLDPSSLTIGQEVQEAMDSSEVAPSYEDEDCEIVEGIFDGYFMIGEDQKKYPVPMNYSSKTKLVPGDVLKLRVTPEGKFIYKLIKPADRKHLKAVLSKTDENKFTANTDDGRIYFLNTAAVTFFRGTPGDELYIIVNEKDPATFAAVEAIIKK